MLMIWQALASIASRAMRTVWIDSSRQIGVVIALLQHRVIHHIVVIERLLDQQQVERIEPREQRRVVERVGGVGVDLQRDVAERRAHALDGVEVPARLDLDLDALIAGRQLLLDLLHQLIERILDADRHARGDAIARAAEHLRQRLARARARRDPTIAISTPALAMLWPRMRCSAGYTSRGCSKRLAEHQRRDEPAMMCHTVSVVSLL